MKELEQEKYNLIFNNIINSKNLKITKLDNNTILYHEYTVAYTEDLKVIIKVILSNDIRDNLLVYENKYDYKNNKSWLINRMKWDYYLKISLRNTLYTIFDTVNNIKEREFINKNFTKEQRKQISLRIFELFKWWIDKYDPVFISRNLNNKKISMNRYLKIHDYIINKNYIFKVISEFDDYITYNYIKKEYRYLIINDPYIYNYEVENKLFKNSLKFK